MNAGRLLLPLATALLATVSIVDPAHADPAQSMATLPKEGLGRPDAPGPLSAVKRATKLSAALKVLGVTRAPPQTLEMRLTPIAPRLANGARIVRAGVVAFNGAEPKEPDGSYTLLRGTGLALSMVEMRVPTEAGKLYVVDCRVRPAPGTGTKFALTRAGTSSLVPVEDGHILAAFAATTTETVIAVGASPSPSDQGAVFGYFYGCDIGKAN